MSFESGNIRDLYLKTDTFVISSIRPICVQRQSVALDVSCEQSGRIQTLVRDRFEDCRDTDIVSVSFYDGNMAVSLQLEGTISERAEW